MNESRTAATGARIKLILILSGAAFSALTMLAWTQPWFTITLVDASVLSVTGEVAAAGLSALALAGLVLGVALSIAGPFFRFVLGTLETFLGVAVVFSSIVALNNPVAASSATISDATSIAGAGPVAELVKSVAISVWPTAALIAGVLLMLNGVLIIVTARRWPGSSRKYQAVRLEPDSTDRTSVDDWDSLTGGEDPTANS
ncbi:MAG: Trp biosynthesis-associated membrane protein [Microbacteriaceae bacterium]